MATITFRCSSCQQALKVGADKAGKKAKCTKCGTALTVPAADEPAPAAPPAPNKLDEDDDGPLTYALKDQEEKKPQEEEGEKKPGQNLEGPGRRIAKKQAKIADGREWRKAAFGMQLIAGGLALWLGAFLLGKLPIVIGVMAGPEFAEPTDERLVTSTNTKDLDLNLPDFAYGVIAGNGAGTAMLWVARLSQLVYLFMYFLLMTGYVICLQVPDRYGTRFQVLVLLALAGANAFFGLIFKLLPLLGLWEWTILPLVAPEVAMVTMNQERLESLLNFWSPVPALDIPIAVVVTFLFYLEPVMIAVFIRGCALSMKVNELEQTSHSLIQMGLGVAFINLSWLLCANCGTSVVLLGVLRVLYLLGIGFFTGQLCWTIVVLLGMPAVVEDLLGDDAAKLDEEEEEEEEEPRAKKRKDEDEEEEEEEVEEVAPAASKRKKQVEEEEVEEVEEED
jgi:hypothetical protein